MSKLYVAAYDLHYPKVNIPTFKAMLAFIQQNKVDGFVFGGDQFDNEEISHHTKGKPLLRVQASYKRNEEAFKTCILTPLEKALKGCKDKVWIVGNHDHWEQQLVECQPELDGLQRVNTLPLDGWKIIPCGEAYKKGKLTFIHGEQLSGVGNQASGTHSKKAVELYCASVLYGHMHSPQSYTKILPHDHSQKWMSWCAPILGGTNPSYLRNRPTAWLNGFVIVEFNDNGNFNVYPVIVANGEFSFGGKLYSHKQAK